jgi:hypothetical protein
MSAKDLATTRAGIQNWGKVLKNEISKQAKIAADAANEAATLWQRGWQNDVNRVLRDFQENVVDKQLDSFDRETQAGLKAIQARYAAQTPEEKALADFEAKRAAADEASKKSDLAAQIADVQSQLDSLGGAATDAGTAVNGTLIDIATGARTALTAAADGAASSATDLVAQRKDLLKQLADLNDQAAQLELDDQERALQAAADASRTAADDKESAEETAYQDDRAPRNGRRSRIASTTRGPPSSRTSRTGTPGSRRRRRATRKSRLRATYNGWVSWRHLQLLPTTSASSASTTRLFDGTDVFGVSPSTPPSAAPTTTSAQRSPAGRSNEAAPTTSTPCSPAKRDHRHPRPDGLFNPDNATSPLYGQLEDRLHPVKLTATYNGVTYGRFYGWVRRFHWEPQGRRGITRLECVDLFYWLDRANPSSPRPGRRRPGAAIGKILDAIGATDMQGCATSTPATRSPTSRADGTKTGLELIQGSSRPSAASSSSPAPAKPPTGPARPADEDELAHVRRQVRERRPRRRLGPGLRPHHRPTRRRHRHRPLHRDRVRLVVVAKVGYNDMPTIQTTYLSSNAQADNLAAWILSQNVPEAADARLHDRQPRDDLLTQILTASSSTGSPSPPAAATPAATSTSTRSPRRSTARPAGTPRTGCSRKRPRSWPCRSSTSRPSTPATSSR